MIKAIVFDCFGVVFQSRLKIFLETCLNEDKRDTFRGLFRAYDRALIGKDELLKAAEHLSGVNAREAEELLFSGFTINLAVADYIKELKAIYKTALLSNIGATTFEVLETELKPYFNVIVPSFRTGIIKPDPEAYKLVAKELGVEPAECIFVDDQERHCAGALAVGMQAVLYEDLEGLRRSISQLT